MKKLVASLLVASMALGLTACGGSSDSTASTGESTGTAAGTEAAATAEATTTNAETMCSTSTWQVSRITLILH